MKLRTYLALLFIMLLSATALASDKPGEVVPYNSLEYPEWSVRISPYGGKLILSDSPETAPEDGILYQDTVSGNVRVFMYHVNGTTTPKRILATLENPGTEPVHITIYKEGYSGPSKNYMDVGKTAQQNYLDNAGIRQIELAPKEIKVIDDKLKDIKVMTNALVNGIYDFTTDAPVTVKVMMLPMHTDIADFARSAKIQPNDQTKLRGTFDGMDRLVLPDNLYRDEDGPVAIILADNEKDKYVTGIDATDGSAAINYGNYGVFYHLFLPTDSSSNIYYFLNPRGGEYAGTLGIKYRHQKPYSLFTPDGRLSLGSDSAYSTYLGSFDGQESLWFTFSPPGASNLPVRLIISSKPQEPQKVKP
ncbi:MAG: copper amine oxidase [Pelosinus sp.]|nr:copper amine oxidase [Pelosinus sp.]